MPHADYALSFVARVPQETGPPILTEVAPILAAENLWWEEQLNGVGEHGCGVNPQVLSDDVKSRLQTPETTPSELWVFRDSQLVAAGPVIGYELDGETLVLRARGLLYYLTYMAVGPSTGDQIFTNTDEFTIAKTIVDAWQSLTYGDYGIDTSSVGTSGMTRDATFRAAKPVRILEAVLRVGRRDGGYDTRVDPATRALQLFSPEMGSILPHIVIDARNVTKPNESASLATGDIATEAYAFTEELNPAVANNPTLLTEFGRAAVWESFDDITNASTLTDHAQRLVAEHDSSLLVGGPELIPLAGADESDFGVGDTVTYDYDLGLGHRTVTRRVAVKRYEASGSGETVKVGFV